MTTGTIVLRGIHFFEFLTVKTFYLFSEKGGRGGLSGHRILYYVLYFQKDRKKNIYTKMKKICDHWDRCSEREFLFECLNLRKNVWFLKSAVMGLSAVIGCYVISNISQNNKKK